MKTVFVVSSATPINKKLLYKLPRNLIALVLSTWQQNPSVPVSRKYGPLIVRLLWSLMVSAFGAAAVLPLMLFR